MMLLRSLLLAVGIASAAAGPGTPGSGHGGPVVDLDYAKYQGYFDAQYGLNVWKGVRYAAPPIGELRWQAPREPKSYGNRVLNATKQPPVCPQSGAARTPKVYGFNSGLGDEDCLFLNVYAPPDAKDLPVFFWIHGGGYGVFGATYDPSPMMNTNNNKFVSVIIQYRLGAFGFLSSDAVHKYGKTNAGLLDMNFALEWVQKHISKFGGDPCKVTIGGESAGAGGVMYQAMAYGGKQKAHLFENLITASPYSPPQYRYNDPDPTGKYDAFVAAVGCKNSNSGKEVFDCLVRADTEVLQNASGKVSESGLFGTFAFLPVTDGDFVRERPSVQLLEGKVNGKRILSGNNANEGVPLFPPTVHTQKRFLSFVRKSFPLLSNDDLTRLQQVYPSLDSSGPLFDTLGTSPPTALEVSEFARGQQQRLFNLFAETSFVCPSYWLASAFSHPARASSSSAAWKYQYSVTPAFHGADLTAYFSAGADVPTRAFTHAFQTIWGRFIVRNSPVISIDDATGGLDNATVPLGAKGAIDWPEYRDARPVLMDLNTTGGNETRVTVTPNLSFTQRFDPGVVNVFRLADAAAWEGGRGERCEFWRSVGARVPQ